MVAEILLSLLDPGPLIAWLVVDGRRGIWDVERINAGETLAEASTPLAARWRGSLTLRLKRSTPAQELHVVLSAHMSPANHVHDVLTPAEFNWFAYNVDRMRGELRAQPGAAAGASVTEPLWGISDELCWFLTHTNDSRHTLSLHLKRYRALPVYVELQSSLGGWKTWQMSAAEFEDFAAGVNHIRSQFPPGSLPWAEQRT